METRCENKGEHDYHVLETTVLERLTESDLTQENKIETTPTNSEATPTVNNVVDSQASNETTDSQSIDTVQDDEVPGNSELLSNEGSMTEQWLQVDNKI